MDATWATLVAALLILLARAVLSVSALVVLCGDPGVPHLGPTVTP